MVDSDDPKDLSIVAKRYNDCLPCRLVSGFGVIGIGLFLAVQGRKQSGKISRYVLYGLATGTAGIGVGRLFNILPKVD